MLFTYMDGPPELDFEYEGELAVPLWGPGESVFVAAYTALMLSNTTASAMQKAFTYFLFTLSSIPFNR